MSQEAHKLPKTSYTFLLQTIANIPGKEGVLVIGEVQKLLPEIFTNSDVRIKRFYYITNTIQDMSVRGGHYHDDGKIELMTCVMGYADVVLKTRNDRGYISTQETILSAGIPQLIYIPPFCWHQVRLSPGAILLVLSNTEYEEGESIQGLPPV